MRNEQEIFWASAFGHEYTLRNKPDASATRAFLVRALQKLPNWPAPRIDQAIELGAGAGHNLAQLRTICPHARTVGVEVNPEAARQLQENCHDAIRCDVLDLAIEPTAKPTFDLVITKGFLIHVAPENLARVYAIMMALGRRYFLVAEYYSPTPVAVTYRGYDNKLWKRDFAGELLDAYSDLRLVDYGFAYHRGPNPQDDLTWFLLEKSQ